MSIVSLIFGRPDAVEIGTLEVDVTISEDHERSTQITSNPVEEGASINDHQIRNPERIQIEGFITDTPAQILGGIAGLGRTQDAFDTLDELWREGELLTVATKWVTYEDMAIVNLTLPRRREQALRFSADLQQVNIVESEITEVPREALAEDVQDSAADTRDAGRQATQEASQAAETGATSALENLIQTVEGQLGG